MVVYILITESSFFGVAVQEIETVFDTYEKAEQAKDNLTDNYSGRNVKFKIKEAQVR